MHFAALLLTLAGQPPPDSTRTLMPVPASFRFGEGHLRVDTAFRVRVTTGADGAPDARLSRAVARFLRRAELVTGLILNRGTGSPTLAIRVAGPGQAVQSPTEVERYTLTIAPDRAELTAPTTVGALRGLETILQLLEPDARGFRLPAVRIEDQPRFPWRGLLIDVARHWEPVEVIKRQLDGMAAVKLNVFHWHLSEDQGFRVESRLYPRLHQMGSDGLYYTQEQIREVVAYARDRGIRVVPEFDVPGHSTSWFVGYPAYASAPGPYTIERRFGVFAPTFDPTREATYQFLDGFIGEMATLFPDPYWHIGGDEVSGTQWRENRRIQAFMRARNLPDNEALQAHFNRRLSAILTRHGKRMVGWDEILHPGLPKTTVVQSWRGQDALRDGARDGYLGILSAGWYLDHMQTTEVHYLVDPVPAGSPLTPAEAARVLGGEACMWAEHITPESIDSRIWPRLAAIAERLWSPREVRDVADMYRRLAVMRVRLEAVGLGHESHTARMTRRLAAGRNPAPLQELLELMEPVRFGERGSRQSLTQLTPLVFAIDAARPDPPAHWGYRSLAAAVLTGAGDGRRRLDSAFARWRMLPGILSEFAEVPLARDVLPAAQALARVTEIGIEALTPPAGPARAEWARARLAALDSLARPQGLLRITVIPAVRMLIEGGGR